ncbi:stalk domain-containing protein [Paenibacillus thermotolerans]|uniref:stalk domain-containing protein n=1 Tax=Paenibacillus thermotolerans TaxID=3027807 RepID=UPI002368ED68|nr:MULTISPECIES: stalk domain-containing protein [unclassified Paenibacillus]
MKSGTKLAAGAFALSVLSFAGGAAAADKLEQVLVYVQPDIKITLNGEMKKLEKSPLVYNGTSYLPLREIAAVTGAEVTWDEKNKTAHINSAAATAPPAANSGSGSSSSSTSVPPQVAVQRPAEIKLKDVIRYSFDYNGKSYPVLVNFVDNSMYLRKIDIDQMGIVYGSIQTPKEHWTGELYIHIDDIKPYWSELPRMTLHQETIINGMPNDDIKNLLIKYLPPSGSKNICLTLSPASEANEYRALLANSDGTFSQTLITLIQIQDRWYVSKIATTKYE